MFSAGPFVITGNVMARDLHSDKILRCKSPAGVAGQVLLRFRTIDFEGSTAMMQNRYDSAQQFWCASAATATICFLAPRPLRVLVPLGIGYFVYRMAQHGFPWGACQEGQACMWRDVDEYSPAGSVDPVDESIQESFPASDPPSFSPGTAAPASQ